MKLTGKKLIDAVLFLSTTYILLMCAASGSLEAEAKVIRRNPRPAVEHVEEIPDDLSDQKTDDAIDIGCEAIDLDKAEWISRGTFRITHYCPCRRCNGKNAGKTASGAIPAEGRTIAASKADFNFGERVLINGKEYVVEDRGVGKGCIDIYVSSHSEALKLGMYRTEIFVRR